MAKPITSGVGNPGNPPIYATSSPLPPGYNPFSGITSKGGSQLNLSYAGTQHLDINAPLMSSYTRWHIFKWRKSSKEWLLLTHIQALKGFDSKELAEKWLLATPGVPGSLYDVRQVGYPEPVKAPATPPPCPWKKE